MAEETNEIYPEIQFFGVSCDKYETLCDEYRIEGYPTLRFFKKDEGPPSMGIEVEFETEDAQDDSVPKKIADLLNLKSNSLRKVGVYFLSRTKTNIDLVQQNHFRSHIA